jgi:SPP1 gp7 family putative phage head morphogenesis protein
VAVDPDKLRAQLEAATAAEAVAIARVLLSRIAVERIGDVAAPITSAQAEALSVEIAALRQQLARHIAGSSMARDIMERVFIQTQYGQTVASAGGVTTVTADIIAGPLREIVDKALRGNPLPSAIVDAAAEKALGKVDALDALIDNEASATVGGSVIDRAGDADALASLPGEIEAGLHADRFGESITTLEQQNAQNEARLDASRDLPDIVAMRYETMMDDRVRDNHAAGEGYMAGVESPVWETHTPPLGWSCRCTLVPVFRGDVPASSLDADGNYIDDPLPPDFHADDGFAPAMSVFGL